MRQIDPWRDPVRDADMKQMDALRAQLEAVTRERDEARATVVTTGRTLADLKLNLDEVHAEMERQTQLKREERQAKLDAMRERDERQKALEVALEERTSAFAERNWANERHDEARADAARLREALGRYGAHHSSCILSSRALMAAHPLHHHVCGCGLDAALASTPSAEPTRAQAERWLNDGPEEAGGTLAFHAEPTPRDMRDMRVAETALREASDMVRDADDGVPLDCLADSIDAIDLAAVVAKAVNP